MTDKMCELYEHAAGEAELLTCSTTVTYSSTPYNCGDFHDCCDSSGFLFQALTADNIETTCVVQCPQFPLEKPDYVF